jgi:murein DD-endopeptidase MepM/ murein hydrolase activator NlpD
MQLILRVKYNTSHIMTAKQDLIIMLKHYTAGFHPVVPFSKTDKLLRLDFTAANTALTDTVLADTTLFTTYINSLLQQAGARYGIGGYGEHRTIYSRSTVFDAADKQEPRRLHLGTDIWGPPHTRVMAPLDGIVHSFGFHPALGNYGAVIILSHQLDGIGFFTLYGHLSLGAIKNLSEGQRIEKGDVFAEFGIPQENGWWPPHLHFQVMQSMQGWKGDYPGVCLFSEKEQWLQNCVDPDLILDMMQYAK